MKQESEKLIEKNLGIAVKKLKGYCLKFWPITVTGFPDRVILLPGGKVCFAELKSTGNTPSPMQRLWIGRLVKLGFWVEVIDTTEKLKSFTEKLAAWQN